MTGLALSLLMAAALGVAPKPADPQAIGRLGDLSGNDLPSVRDGVVFANVALDFMGTPMGCTVVKSGSRWLDLRTCAGLMRLRYVPARDEAGVPVASVYSTAVRWSTGGYGSPGYLVDETVEVGKLPAGAAQPVVAVRQVIDPDGSVESCEVDQGSGVAGLDRLACGQAEGLGKLGPVKDRSGKPVRTLRVSHIQFAQKAG